MELYVSQSFLNGSHRRSDRLGGETQQLQMEEGHKLLTDRLTDSLGGQDRSVSKSADCNLRVVRSLLTTGKGGGRGFPR